MLIEFSVENCLSIRERQTLSMAAAKRIGKSENVFQADLKGGGVLPLLKVAAVYGPNASGKSNLIICLKALQALCVASPEKGLGKNLLTPFRFDRDLLDKPSKFEIHFVAEQQRYSYELGFTTERVCFEQLSEFNKNKQSIIYTRSVESDQETYDIKNLEGTPELHQLWCQATNEKSTFLSAAVYWQSEEFHQLKKPWKWLQSLTILKTDLAQYLTSSLMKAMDNEVYAQKLIETMSRLDFPISQIETVRRADSLFEFDDEMPVQAFNRNLVSTFLNTTLTHSTRLGEAHFSIDEESQGTKNLIALMSIWLDMVDDKAGNKKILIIDELDQSIHPEIMSQLLKEFVNSDVSRQVIFTTHSTNIMSRGVLRRDQIYLTERDRYGATHLRSIHDFAGREGEDIEKRYFEGRYRSLPVIQRERRGGKE